MQAKHLTYFKVENFKRFESFEMNNIGQFNLILGDNNVGKTSVLEALLFDLEDANQFRDNLLTVLYDFRKIEPDTENPLNLLVKGEKYTLSVSYDHNYAANEKAIFAISVYTTLNTTPNILVRDDTVGKNAENIKAIIINSSKNEGGLAKQSIPYIPFHLGYDNDLVHFYNSFIEPSKSIESNFIEALKSVLPTIDGLKVGITPKNTPFLRISQTDKDERIALSMFGEGTIKLFRILMKIVVHRGKRLMIDEIDAGVHFKKFKDFWRTILLAAKQNEVQIFATTHNEECLVAFKEILEETELLGFQQDARCFELLELPNKQVKAYTLSYEEFAAMIETKTNIRGGNYQNG
jgi:AAA15 family ATPase/GTPase